MFQIIFDFPEISWDPPDFLVKPRCWVLEMQLLGGRSSTSWFLVVNSHFNIISCQKFPSRSKQQLRTRSRKTRSVDLCWLLGRTSSIVDWISNLINISKFDIFSSFCRRNPHLCWTSPSGLALDSTSQLLYIADTENGRVRCLDLSAGTIRTIAGGATTDEVSGKGKLGMHFWLLMAHIWQNTCQKMERCGDEPKLSLWNQQS